MSLCIGLTVVLGLILVVLAGIWIYRHPAPPEYPPR